MQLRHEPVALVLSRQALPTLDRTKYAPADGVAKGAYLLADSNGGLPEVIPLGSGSEVSLCVEAHEQLTTEGVRFHVVRIIDRFRAVGPDVLEGRAHPGYSHLRQRSGRLRHRQQDPGDPRRPLSRLLLGAPGSRAFCRGAAHVNLWLVKDFR
jgi:hypothetical protein